jgi:hypothetical protein
MTRVRADLAEAAGGLARRTAIRQKSSSSFAPRAARLYCPAASIALYVRVMQQTVKPHLFFLISAELDSVLRRVVSL